MIIRIDKCVSVVVSGDEVAIAIIAYLAAHNVYVSGPRTVRINGDLCAKGEVNVDPSGFVMFDGFKYA